MGNYNYIKGRNKNYDIKQGFSKHIANYESMMGKAAAQTGKSSHIKLTSCPC
jgi:hypothetical protein